MPLILLPVIVTVYEVSLLLGEIVNVVPLIDAEVWGSLVNE